MTLLRVMLGQMPSMLRDILEGMLADEPDIEVVRGAGEANALQEQVRLASPDVLVISAAGNERARDYVGLLCTRPAMRLVTIAEDGRSAAIHALRLDRSLVREVSLDTLLAALRGGVAAEETKRGRGE